MAGYLVGGIFSAEVIGAGLVALGARIVLLGEGLSKLDLEEVKAGLWGRVAGGTKVLEQGKDWFFGLSELHKGPIIAGLTFLVALSLVMIAPVVVKLIYGDLDDLERVKPPKKGAFIGDVPRNKFPLMECRNPANGEILGYVANMDKEEVHRRVQKARRAAAEWSKTSFKERRRFLRCLSKYTLTYQDEICEVTAKDTGKTLFDATLGEIIITMEKLRWLLQEGESALQPEVRKAGPFAIHRHNEVMFEPLGVIGTIQPWNYPYHNMMNTVGAALFAGNACVMKVSEYSGWCSTYCAQIVREALIHCGHSPDIFQVITGDSAAGEALVGSGIDKLFFTGSTEVGRKVAKRAGELLLPVELELGGKDAAIVCDDTNLLRASRIITRATFQNSGQNCIAVERIIVQDTIYDEFVDIMTDAVQELRQGDYRNLLGIVDVGAMTMERKAIFHVQRLVNDAVAKGAKLLVGGEENKFVPNGNFYKPTLLVDVTNDMLIAQEETFGPVSVIMKFNDDDEAIKLANSTIYGLNGCVFVKSKSRAKKYIEGVRTGMMHVNDFTCYTNQGMPFGGVKASGYGRFAGVEGLRGCCLMKSVSTDKVPFIHTDFPRLLRYPVLPQSGDYIKEIIYLCFSEENLLKKWDNLRNIIIMSLFNGFKPPARMEEWFKDEPKSDDETTVNQGIVAAAADNDAVNSEDEVTLLPTEE